MRLLTSPLLELVGMNIRTFRSQFNMTQEELARMVGLHRTYIGAVERGERNISILSLEKIALALKINITEFFK